MNETRLMYLHCLHGKERGRRFALTAGQVYHLGRDPAEPAIVLADVLASRMHARLTMHDDYAQITDIGSANGTRVNGQTIQAQYTLHPGDIITIGQTSLLFEDPRVASSQDLQQEGTRSVRKRQSERLKKAIEHHRTVQMTLGQDAQPGEAAVLTNLLASLPLALIVMDDQRRLLLTSSLTRELADLDATPGSHGDSLLASLAVRCAWPEEFRSVIAAADGSPQSVELAEGGPWTVWCWQRGGLTTIYILPQEALGTTPEIT